MAKKIENSRIHYTAGATPEFGPQDFEIVVAPKPAARDGLKKYAREHWDSAAIAQFQKKITALDSYNGSDDGVVSLRVNLSAGGFTSFVFINQKISTFELHTELRKAVGDVPELLLAESEKEKLALDVHTLGLENQRRTITAICFLFETANWKPVVFGKRAAKEKSRALASSLWIESALKPREAEPLVSRARWLGEANNWVRTLAVLPTNELGPVQYRKWIQSFCKGHGLTYDFLDRRELEKRKAGGFLAVTRADENTGGGIARIRYRPRKGTQAKSKKKLVLVGKGICFDTGGYNVKVGNYMLGMHGDMTGSALALALCGLYAALEVDFEVVAYLALAENLISPTAYKPNEVVVASNGVSIEVVDTDAEGRMVLSDTLAIASEEKADLMIDYATLTGAAMRALDTRRGAVFSNQPRLLDRAVKCGDESGERVWGFPIGADYRKELESKVADIRQCGPGDHADHIYAATFLSEFVDAKVPWLHLDLTPAENKGGLGLLMSETTGFGVLWTDALVRDLIS